MDAQASAVDSGGAGAGPEADLASSGCPDSIPDLIEDGSQSPRGPEGREMVTYAGCEGCNEPCVSCVVTDETSTDWQSSRYSYSLPQSSSATDLYSCIAKEARYEEGSFALLWAKQEEGGRVVETPVEWQSTATLHELGMCGRAKLLLRETQDGTAPRRIQQVPLESPPVKTVSYGPLPSSSPPPSSTSGTSTPHTTHTSSYADNTSVTSWSYYNYNAKSDTGFVGLVNQAMTCYLNSLLQTLYMTPEFRNALYGWRCTNRTSILYELQRLFIQLQMSPKRAVETTDLTRSFGWDSSEAWQQHDVQELCRVLFDAMEKQFKKDQPEEAQLINQLYQGTMKDYVKCLTCEYESAREDHFLDIPLVIKPFGSSGSYTSVMQALHSFVQPETLDGDNQYWCEKCNAKQNAHKGLKFTKFPYLLTLQLKRFDFDYNSMHRIKLNDRMEFPKVLDLNGFAEMDHEGPSTPSGTQDHYHSFVVDTFENQPRPPSYSSATKGVASGCGHSSGASSGCGYNTGAYTINNCTESESNPSIQISNDSTGEVCERCGVEEGRRGGEENTGEEDGLSFVGRLMQKGPYVYELFSIMIHSGSAIGGHYYAYIKSLADKRWYCFNDQTVSKITDDDIEQAFGGTTGRSRGYYSSMYSSSANAYMLMYRRIDYKKNKDFITTGSLPQHILEQIRREKEEQRREKAKQENEKNLCKFRLFCKLPRSGELLEKKLEVHKDSSLKEATELAYELLGLGGCRVPVDRCRLVRYDEYMETLDQSFDEKEDVPFGELVGGPRSYYTFELFMEVREKDQVFRPYRKGGLNLQLLVVDAEREEVGVPMVMRAELGWTVAELKREVAEHLHLSVEHMRVALETYNNEGRLLSNSTNVLRSEGFYRKHTVFVCCDEKDFCVNFADSNFQKMLDKYANSILLSITLPPSLPTHHKPTHSLHEQDKASPVDADKREGEGEGEAQKQDDGGSAGASGGESRSPDKCSQKVVSIRIDRRKTLSDLKKLLEQHVGVASTQFKVYRVYTQSQEYEMTRLGDSLQTLPSDTKLVVKLGRALKQGEFRIKIFLLDIRSVDYSKHLLDTIVAKGMTVQQFKEQIVSEIEEDPSLDYHLSVDKLRLRKKTWRSAGTIYLDSQVFEKDIHVFANFEMYLEPLKGGEKMLAATSIQVYVRRWRPSTHTVDLTDEVVVTESTPDHLRKKISEISDVPQERVDIAKAYGSFPCEMSVLDINEDLEWNPSVTNINSIPFSIYDDGCVVYYRDAEEKAEVLSAERKNELQKQENTRLSKYNSTPTYSSSSYRVKERALKIYVADDEAVKEAES